MINKKAIYKCYPDLTFIIDIPYEIGLSNRSKTGEINRLDLESPEFHERVNRRFREIAESYPERCILIPYEDEISNVQDKIRKKFSERFLSV